MNELRGTFDCPICGWPTPHSHTHDEIAERPQIDGARTAFEREAHEFLKSKIFEHMRTGYWWGLPAEMARISESGPLRATDGDLLEPAKYAFNGWSQRCWPQGPYSNDYVEIMWRFWRIAWLSAKRANPIAANPSDGTRGELVRANTDAT